MLYDRVFVKNRMAFELIQVLISGVWNKDKLKKCHFFMFIGFFL